MTRISELTEKVELYKKQCAEEAQHADEVAPLNHESGLSHISIIKPKHLKESVLKNAHNVKQKFPSISVNIESKTLSLGSKAMKSRNNEDLEDC